MKMYKESPANRETENSRKNVQNKEKKKKKEKYLTYSKAPPPRKRKRLLSDVVASELANKPIECEGPSIDR